MTPFLRGMVQATVATFELPAPIVEIGSYQVEGQKDLIDLRRLFPGRPYLGIDMRPGPGVDQVENVEHLTLKNHSAGTVLALSTFEHVRRFWLGVSELKRIIRPHGALLISCPFAFHIHNHPSDYWRFTPEALDSLLDDQFPQRILGQHGPAKRPIDVWALAFGRDVPPVTDETILRYAKALKNNAKTPMKAGRSLRYRIGQLICGKGPFRDHFEHDRITLELRTGRASHADAA